MIDEIHELIAIALQKESKQIGLFKSLVNLKRDFTWGITGTPDNLNFYGTNTIIFSILRLSDEYYSLGTMEALKHEFVTHCIRSNPRSVDLPKLHKSVRRVYFGQI